MGAANCGVPADDDRARGKCGFLFLFKFAGKVLCRCLENKIGTENERYSFSGIKCIVS